MAVANLQSALREAERFQRWAMARPCRVRPDWQRPEKPQGDYYLCVHLDDGWHLHWHSDTEAVDYIAVEGPPSWPFIEESAWPEDWEKLGIDVV